MRRKISETNFFLYRCLNGRQGVHHVFGAFFAQKHSQQALRKYIHSVTYLRCLLGGNPPNTPCAYKFFLTKNFYKNGKSQQDF
jgi:hypothetical protein